MAVTLTGLASGFDWATFIDQILEVERAPQRQLRTEQDTLNERNTAYGSIKTELSVLQTRLETLKDPTLYDSRTAAVADSTVATAVASKGAANGTYTFNIVQLATSAKRDGASNIGTPLNTGVALSSAGFSTAITAGTFTVNGKQVTVATTDTLTDVFGKIATATGNAVTAGYNATDDKIELSSGGEILLGSATDTSNFLQATRLYNNGTGTVASANALGGVLINATISASNLATAITDGGSGAGEFKINGVSIAFDSATDSIANVLTRINNSTAGVTASYDYTNDRFVLTNKTTGDMDIALEDVTGNFLSATGLTSGTLTHGKNLFYTVNGGTDQFVSQSNTITEASSGIAGLSVTALKEGEATTVTVTTDMTKIKDAINSFIEAYNRAQSLIDTQTASSTDAKGVVTAGVLAADSDASEIASRLRNTIYAQTTGLSGVFDHLADLGISTNSDDNNLKLEDGDLLDTALTNSLNDVKDLFTNETSGLAVKLADYLERTVGDNGSLIAKQDGLAKQSSEIDTQVVDLERIVQADRERMVLQFTAMETTQQRLNQQLQYLLQQLGTSS